MLLLLLAVSDLSSNSNQARNWNDSKSMKREDKNQEMKIHFSHSQFFFRETSKSERRASLVYTLTLPRDVRYRLGFCDIVRGYVDNAIEAIANDIVQELQE